MGSLQSAELYFLIMKCFKCPAQMMDMHHCFMGQQKNAPKPVRDFLNNEINLQPLCRDCHTHHGGKSNRQAWMKHQISVYGRDEILKWLDSAPRKKKLNDRWSETRRMADYSSVGAGWNYGKTGGVE